jgi:hypothetical protein
MTILCGIKKKQFASSVKTSILKEISTINLTIMNKQKLKDLIWTCFLIEEQQDEQFSKQDFADLITNALFIEVETYLLDIKNGIVNSNFIKNTSNTSNM